MPALTTDQVLSYQGSIVSPRSYQHDEMQSKCKCDKELFQGKYMVCKQGLKWLALIEARTDLEVDF